MTEITSFECVRCQGKKTLYWGRPCGHCDGTGFLALSDKDQQNLFNIVETVEDAGGVLIVPGSVNCPGKRGPIKIGTLQGLAAKGLLDCMTVVISPWGIYHPGQPLKSVHVRVSSLAYAYLTGRDLASTVSAS